MPFSRPLTALFATASLVLATLPAHAETRSAIFAGGCFWCVESDFDKVPGVLSTTSGYTGGDLQNPTYENHHGHKEAVQIEYDDTKVDYATLLDVFWHSVDPTDGGGQFCDRGDAYETAIFTGSPEEKKLAESTKASAAEALKQPIVTPIVAAGTFWPAEDYHQDYYTKNSLRYKYYRYACGRDQRLEELWGADAHKGIPSH
ncbi:peptide-methionine (S)-S-oxide reductase MsrA [Tianweitania sediminis]|uniref:Peptide methionine sulfoxide reductase MsrA n=1 Tax=Tianweitania sediminis TaxID=1502156 RepID=A0A8J7R4V4_9HYPH|nr:peptide-methionine (S)-S-oxide reductase MsrA [Tianweitania sediminis]MBP0437547.1 peptide-methionine (S)-S-oxide reductase MsrA [Tianweitania sediminis]